MWSRKLVSRLKSNWIKLGIRVKYSKINFKLLEVKFSGIKSISYYDEVSDNCERSEADPPKAASQAAIVSWELLGPMLEPILAEHLSQSWS